MSNNTFLENFYNEYDEDGRLENNCLGRVEYLTTRRYLDPLLTADCKIAEIGAGTGRYSVTLAKEGYDVTAVELVQHNLDILQSKLDGSENIKTYLGNALDLNILEDNTYDITLLLGPMYHLYSEEDKITALKEAVRITKSGGHILVAYCMNEATVIQYVFGCNQLKSVMDLNMITDDWKCISEPKDLFEMVRVEDIERLNASVPVKRVKLVATDGASRYIREYLEEFDDETFAKWLSYHFATCERQDLIGATNHSLSNIRFEVMMYYCIENCKDGDAEYIIDRLVEYNLSQVPAKQEVLFDTLDKKITDDNGKIIAGCVARMYCWNVAYIDTLWVDETYRGKGLGAKLLAEVENTAKEKGCYLIHLDTFDFQAKDFYEKQGYKLFGVLEDCPKGHCRYYLRKTINLNNA